jgi:shikimate kinase
MVLTIKIGILGKMGSGKTTLATEFIKQYPNFVKIAFADKVKELAIDLFNMKGKDRTLLQEIGENMRSIDPDVWVNYAIEKSKGYNYVVIDDVRYENEIVALKNNGYTIIYLDIDRSIQLERLRDTYGDNFQHHAKGDSHGSEQANHFKHLADINLHLTNTEMTTTFVKTYLDHYLVRYYTNGMPQEILINNNQALDLEIKINKSCYNIDWEILGDILYKWRLEKAISNTIDEYYITKEQSEWILEHIDNSKRYPPPQYKLIIRD